MLSCGYPSSRRAVVASFGRGVVDHKNGWSPEVSPAFLVHGDGAKDCAEKDMAAHVCTPHLLQTLYIRGTGVNPGRPLFLCSWRNDTQCMQEFFIYLLECLAVQNKPLVPSLARQTALCLARKRARCLDGRRVRGLARRLVKRGAEGSRYNETCGSSLRSLGRVTDHAKGR
jgi:hypothetical protein